MAKPEWGTKRSCQSCGAKFYDLKRNPIACPSCGTRFDPEALLKSRRGRSTPAPKAAPKVVAAKEESDEILESSDDELDDTVEAGDDDLLVDDDMDGDEGIGEVVRGPEKEET
ncbi:MAG: TIGR02300 family protein [Pseudomonadota bacterium]